MQPGRFSSLNSRVRQLKTRADAVFTLTDLSMAKNASSPAIELYWDVGSTNTYFAFKLLQPIVRRWGAKLVLHPFNIGHVFRENSYVLMNEPPAKLANRKRDLMRWAEKYQLPFNVPAVFPIKTSRVLRGSIAMREWGLEHAFVEAALDAYWERGDHTIAQYEGLRPIVQKLGVDPAVFETAAESDAVRQALVESTNQGLERGVFGVPSIFVGDELYWGKDRMDFIEDELRRLAYTGRKDAVTTS